MSLAISAAAYDASRRGRQHSQALRQKAIGLAVPPSRQRKAPWNKCSFPDNFEEVDLQAESSRKVHRKNKQPDLERKKAIGGRNDRAPQVTSLNFSLLLHARSKQSVFVVVRQPNDVSLEQEVEVSVKDACCTIHIPIIADAMVKQSPWSIQHAEQHPDWHEFYIVFGRKFGRFAIEGKPGTPASDRIIQVAPPLASKLGVNSVPAAASPVPTHQHDAAQFQVASSYAPPIISPSTVPAVEEPAHLYDNQHAPQSPYSALYPAIPTPSSFFCQPVIQSEARAVPPLLSFHQQPMAPHSFSRQATAPWVTDSLGHPVEEAIGRLESDDFLVPSFEQGQHASAEPLAWEHQRLSMHDGEGPSAAFDLALQDLDLSLGSSLIDLPLPNVPVGDGPEPLPTPSCADTFQLDGPDNGPDCDAVVSLVNGDDPFWSGS